ncbi:unnamed protein product [Candidula unifasciata]|uniref:C2H2-type domain-containing protein n=1 Tax=Candidula unifasciata TaxID=100452 RepID=A0A8S3YYF2_9EUPU|nr:unnamed protein product [Candidula unifasciata]
MEDRSLYGNSSRSPGPSDRRPAVDSAVSFPGSSDQRLAVDSAVCFPGQGQHWHNNIIPQSLSRSVNYCPDSSFERHFNYLETTQGERVQYRTSATDLTNSGYPQGAPVDFSGRPCFPGMPSTWSVLSPMSDRIQQPSHYATTYMCVNERAEFAFPTASKNQQERNETAAAIDRDSHLLKDVGSRCVLSERCDVSDWGHTGSRPAVTGKLQNKFVDSKEQSVTDTSKDGIGKNEDETDKDGAYKGKFVTGTDRDKDGTVKNEDGAYRGKGVTGTYKGKDVTGKKETNKDVTGKDKNGSDKKETDLDKNSKAIDASATQQNNVNVPGNISNSNLSADETTDDEDKDHEDLDSDDSQNSSKDEKDGKEMQCSDQSSVDGAVDDVVSVDGEDHNEDVVSVDGEDHDEDVVIVGLVEQPPPVEDSSRFQCSLCQNSYKFKKGLNRHLKKTHPGQLSAISKQGQLMGSVSFKDARPHGSKTQAADGTHLEVTYGSDSSVRAFSCSQCSYKAKKRKDLKKHMVVHSTLKVHKCSLCTFSSKRRYSLRRHLKTHAPSSARSYECALCSFKVSGFDSFKTHIGSHVTSSTKSCTICGTVIRERTNLIEHIIRHSMGQKAACRDCETIILRCRKYMSHVLSHKAGSQNHVSLGQGTSSASRSLRSSLPSNKGKSLLNNLSLESDLSELSALKSRLLQMSEVANFFNDKSKLVIQLAELSALATELAVASGNVLQSYNMAGDIHWETPGLAESIDALDLSFVEEFALSSLFGANMAAVKGEYPANHYPAMDTDMQIEVDFNGDAVSCIQQGKRIQQAGGAHGQRSKHLVCTHCNMVLHDFSSLKRHLDMHMDVRPHICDKCGQSFRRKGHLKKHMITHSADRPFVCTECQYRTKTEDQLNSHMTFCHSQNGEFPCQLCNYSASDSFELGLHMKKHKPQTCPQCGCVCYSRQEFNKHLSTHSSFDCTQCEFSTGCRREYNRHMRKHSAHCFNCELCGYTCNSMKLFQYHKLRHENRTPYQCPDCEYKCSSRASYRCHRYKHAGLKPFLCSICGASFVKSSHLSQHMLIHKDLKEFKCSMCAYSCRTKHNLKEHEMTHTGEKPYVCMYCNFSSRRKKALLIHMMKHERF